MLICQKYFIITFAVVMTFILGCKSGEITKDVVPPKADWYIRGGSTTMSCSLATSKDKVNQMDFVYTIIVGDGNPDTVSKSASVLFVSNYVKKQNGNIVSVEAGPISFGKMEITPSAFLCDIKAQDSVAIDGTELERPFVNPMKCSEQNSIHGQVSSTRVLYHIVWV